MQTALPNDDYCLAGTSEAQLKNIQLTGFWGTVQSGVTSGTGWTTTQLQIKCTGTFYNNSGSTTDALHIEALIFCCNDS